MANHSNILAWRIPGTAEPGALPSMASHRVGYDCNDLAAAAASANIPKSMRLHRKGKIKRQWQEWESI